MKELTRLDASSTNECQIQDGTMEDTAVLELHCCLNGFDVIYAFNKLFNVFKDIRNKVSALAVHLCTDCMISKACIM